MNLGALLPLGLMAAALLWLRRVQQSTAPVSA